MLGTEQAGSAGFRQSAHITHYISTSRRNRAAKFSRDDARAITVSVFNWNTASITPVDHLRRGPSRVGELKCQAMALSVTVFASGQARPLHSDIWMQSRGYNR